MATSTERIHINDRFVDILTIEDYNGKKRFGSIRTDDDIVCACIQTIKGEIVCLGVYQSIRDAMRNAAQFRQTTIYPIHIYGVNVRFPISI